MVYCGRGQGDESFEPFRNESLLEASVHRVGKATQPSQNCLLSSKCRVFRGREGRGTAMADGMKQIGSFLWGWIGLLAFIAVVVGFFKGPAWMTYHVAIPAITLSWIVLGVDILLLLPLSMFRSLRGLTGTALF